MTNFLIRGGTVVDGTGAASFRADVRVTDGVISEVGLGLAEKGERVVDAEGCIVSPGFIEAHTHYDAAMWWQPALDPLPGNGVTTVIMGNCGFAAAPLSKDKQARLEMIKIFSFFEDIPIGPFLEHVPWDWDKWSEYKKSVLKNVKVPCNYATFTGHIALRLAAMGMDAWERKATPEEVARMAELLEDAMDAGALGLSDNLHDHDGDDRPVPSLLADDAEFSALFDVLERYPGATYQVIVDTFMRKRAPQQMERLEKLLKGKKLRVQVAGGIPTLEFQKDMLEPMRNQLGKMRAEGIDVWPGYAHVSPTNALSITKSLIFAQSNDYVWHEVVLAETPEEKERLLRDPEWRKRARESWDTKAWAWSPMNQPENLNLLDSENGTGPVGITLAEYIKQRGGKIHRSDAMADWILANGLKSTVHLSPFPKDEKLTRELMLDPKTVGNISDAGAHLQMLCGAGENMLLFTKYVNDNDITLEQAIHIQTGKLTNFFGLHDRGEIRVGKAADIVVFNLDEIKYHNITKKNDVPDGKGGTSWRFTREAAPMRLTLVNGVVTFENGQQTDNRPGVFLAPSAGEDAAELRQAAE